ncbi:hypothetical protein Fmac_028611 [Flemingia macrophylla]|uniref:Uncharacterized protein n=1 Tax=Flemingia macrophylla TaxID=520843 RepID=A0ABD1L801_9FABA
MSLLQESATSVLPMTTILVSVLLRSNLEWMSILRLMLQTPIADHHTSRDKALDREDGSQLLALRIEAASVARVCGIRSSNDHHTSTTTAARDKALDREDGSQLLAFGARNDAILESKPASIARVCDIRSSNDHHTSVCPSSQQSGVDEHPEAYVANTYSRPPQQRDKALDREDGSQLLAIRKLEGKLDALVNLVTQLAVNQKPASVARVCGIRSSNDHHTSVCPSSQQSGVDEHPEAYFSARNDVIVIRGVHDVATRYICETRKLEGKLDALVNLVTQLAANQKPASVARVCGIVLPMTTILVSVLLAAIWSG